MEMRDFSAANWDAAVALTLNSPSQAIRTAGVAGLACELPAHLGDTLTKLDKLCAVINKARLKPKPLSSIQFNLPMKGQQQEEVIAWLGRQSEIVQTLLLSPLLTAMTETASSPRYPLLLKCPPSAARTNLLMLEIANMARSDPQAAADLSLSLPPGTEHDYAVLNTAVRWSRNDPAAAKAWVNALPDSQEKQMALEELK